MKVALITATLSAAFGKHLDWSCPGIPFYQRLLAVCGYAAAVGWAGLHMLEG